MDEIVGLNGRERDRLVVLRQVKEGKLTQREAAEQLKISRRWVKKLVKRLRQEGDRGLAHRLRGKRSNRRLPQESEQAAIEVIRERYADYGPTLASEMLEQAHGLKASRETVRKWMIGSKLWKARRERLSRVHVWRQRRSRRGELAQWDTSEHAWLEKRTSEKLYLIAMIDDATSVLTARFAAHDSTEENMRLLNSYIEQWGRPVEVYTDKAGLFQVNRPVPYSKQVEEEARTQIGRALVELGIGWIPAQSPQAKGRVERSFGTMQDRLVKGLRRAGARTLEEAERYLQAVFVPEWNGRWAKPPADNQDAHRPLRKDQDLASILSTVEERTVGNDYTIRWRGKQYQLAAEVLRPRMRKDKIRIEQRLDGRLTARWENREIPLQLCAAAPPAVIEAAPQPAPKARKPKRWMDGFWVRNPAKRGPIVPVTPVALRAPSVTGTTKTGEQSTLQD
ncbi:MAG: ISNCY family transposase [Terriglobales bacterium]